MEEVTYTRKMPANNTKPSKNQLSGWLKTGALVANDKTPQNDAGIKWASYKIPKRTVTPDSKSTPIKKVPAKAIKPIERKPRKQRTKTKSPSKVGLQSASLRDFLKTGAIAKAKTPQDERIEGSQPVSKTTPTKPTKRTTKFNRNDSFDELCRENDRKLKLMLETVAKHQQHQKCMEKIGEIEKRFTKTYNPVNFEDAVPEKPAEVPLDCYDMTDQEIRDAFNKNMDYLTDIVNERIPNPRHDLFKAKSRNTRTITMSYNVSMVAFTIQHKRILANKLSKYFDRNNGDNYYFVVLLPELCLKIFMDRYNMTYDEAYKYLDEAPFVDDC